ncbi:MAG TPA: glutamate-5-semialdehyde dehydrogenase, partial [Ilumatobacteraceae bacterium]|nr:glutamate-5-semialdehyde dehydrogenase [Ilumatobacteraceae bacterium]
MSSELLSGLQAGQPIPYGGNRISRVSTDLAEAFVEGDRLVVVQTTGDLLHIPQAIGEVVDTAVSAAVEAFYALAGVSDQQITHFFDAFANALADDATFAAIAAANRADVAAAVGRGRQTGRLELGESMRAGMIEALQMWRDTRSGRSAQIGSLDHHGWSVQTWRGPLGVVGFVFEGRPNVFADACGVLRTGNSAVLRIGSDALDTARAIVDVALRPALADAGLPTGCVQLVDTADRLMSGHAG